MSLEDKLREMILAEYGSIQEFSNVTGIKYTTVFSILNRGVNKASINNIITMCHALGISTDELAAGRITPTRETIERRTHITDIDTIISFTKKNIQEYSDLTIGGQPMTQNEIEMLLDALDIGIGLIKRNRGRNKE